MDDIGYIIGQVLGVVAIALGFLSYQMKHQRQILLLQLITTVVFLVHYLLIGATSGMAMNVVNFFKTLTYYYRSKHGKTGWAVPILFGVAMAAIGILTWEAWYSIFVVLGLLVHAIGMAFTNPQNVRRSILVSSPLVLIYDIFVRSYGGIVYESVAVISSAIGLYRHRKENS